MPLWLLFLIHTLVVYRVARFIAEDSLIEGWRKAILFRLNAKDASSLNPRLRDDPREFFKGKAFELLQCPYCLTIWIGAGVVGIHLIWLDGLPVPVWWWLALSGGALVWWSIIEDE